MFKPFELEPYFAQHEFSSRYLLCTSDCESMTVGARALSAHQRSPQAPTALPRLPFSKQKTPRIIRAEANLEFIGQGTLREVFHIIPVRADLEEIDAEI